MYGINVHKAVFNKSCQVSGASVHFVNKFYDEGKIIAQRCIDISDVKSPEEIAGRVLKIEHQLLPFVIKKISENKKIHSSLFSHPQTLEGFNAATFKILLHSPKYFREG